MENAEVYERWDKLGDHSMKGFAYKMVRQNAEPAASDSTVSNPNYDSVLAEKLGGDDYGMKSYILVILKTGPNTSTDRELISASFRGHLDNINRLVEEGKLIVAVPLGANEHQYRGIFILNNVESIEEAAELMQTDPAIKSGLLVAEFFNWYGSAALPEYLPASDKIWKQKP
ncbi:MAG: YciI family protein [Cyclonatronaceae bacterium]